MRASIASIVFGAGIVSGCGFGPASVLFTFDNRTDSVLCEYPSPQDDAGARCLAQVEPRTETHWGRDCDNQESRPIRVFITVKQGGRQIYDRTASRGKWDDTKRRFVIERQGDEFIVTVSLPTASPAR